MGLGLGLAHECTTVQCASSGRNAVLAPRRPSQDPALKYGGGATLGNSWRIYGDGGSWRAITGALNTMAQLANFTKPGGYSDPDNILGPHGTVGRVSESQARVQMVMWAIFPTQLIIGEDVTKMSDEYIETVGNEELIAVNQDAPFVSAASRIVGGDLSYPCNSGGGDTAVADVVAEPCVVGSATQLFYFNASDSSLRPTSQAGMVATSSCDFSGDGNIVSVFAPGHGGTGCGGANWVHSASGAVVGAAGKCLDEYEYTTPRVDLWGCQANAKNEQWAWKASGSTVGGFAVGTLTNLQSGKCLTAAPPAPPQECTNVWSRPLANGDVVRSQPCPCHHRAPRRAEVALPVRKRPAHFAPAAPRPPPPPRCPLPPLTCPPYETRRSSPPATAGVCTAVLPSRQWPLSIKGAMPQWSATLLVLLQPGSAARPRLRSGTSWRTPTWRH